MSKEYDTRLIEGYCVRFDEERAVLFKGEKVYLGRSLPVFYPTINYCEDLDDCPHGRKCSIYWGHEINW